MASDWRFNVWLFGLGPGPDLPTIGLASRLLISSPAGAIQTNGIWTAGHNAVVWPPGTVLPENYFITGGIKNVPHFPYGWGVEPDMHT